MEAKPFQVTVKSGLNLDQRNIHGEAYEEIMVVCAKEEWDWFQWLQAKINRSIANSSDNNPPPQAHAINHEPPMPAPQCVPQCGQPGARELPFSSIETTHPVVTHVDPGAERCDRCDHEASKQSGLAAISQPEFPVGRPQSTDKTGSLKCTKEQESLSSGSDAVAAVKCEHACPQSHSQAEGSQALLRGLRMEDLLALPQHGRPLARQEEAVVQLLAEHPLGATGRQTWAKLSIASKFARVTVHKTPSV